MPNMPTKLWRRWACHVANKIIKKISIVHFVNHWSYLHVLHTKTNVRAGIKILRCEAQCGWFIMEWTHILPHTLKRFRYTIHIILQPITLPAQLLQDWTTKDYQPPASLHPKMMQVNWLPHCSQGSTDYHIAHKAILITTLLTRQYWLPHCSQGSTDYHVAHKAVHPQESIEYKWVEWSTFFCYILFSLYAIGECLTDRSA